MLSPLASLAQTPTSTYWIVSYSAASPTRLAGAWRKHFRWLQRKCFRQDIKLAELGAPILLRCGERPRPLHAGPDRPHPKNTHLRLGRQQPSGHSARRDGGGGTRHHDGASRQEG